MSNTASDSELLQASVSGSREAFSVIVQRYQAPVCAITYSATGDLGTSEELAQEAFVSAWQNLWQLKDLRKFRPWLYTIARNLAVKRIRRRSGDLIDQASALAKARRMSSGDSDPSQAAVTKERQELVWSALHQVPERYREPMVLFYRRERSVSEVAVDLGLSEEAVRQRLHRGRQLIKAEVSSLVEDVLGSSGPGKVFTVAVVAALPAVTAQTAGAAVLGAKGVPAAKALWPGVVSGAILGPILGVLGGVLGAWCSIKDTSSPRERRFVIRMVVFMWLLIFVLIGLPLTLALVGSIPKAAFWSCSTLFFALLLPLILWSNARQERIQIQEGTYRRPEYSPVRITRRGLYASFGGGILGGTLWLLILAWLARDWVSFGAILAGDVLILLAVTEFCVRDLQRYWSAAVLMIGALMAVTLTVVNLRWTVWMHAYRQSTVYEPRGDVSLTTVNLILLGVFLALLALFTTRYVRHKAIREDQTPDGRES